MTTINHTSTICLVCGQRLMHPGRGVWVCPQCDEDFEQELLVAGGQGRHADDVIAAAIIVGAFLILAAAICAVSLL